jgi:hypothetical protein
MGAIVEIDGLHDHMQAAVVGIEGDIPLRIAPNAAERQIAGACARDQPLVVPHRTRDAAGIALCRGGGKGDNSL